MGTGCCFFYVSQCNSLKSLNPELIYLEKKNFITVCILHTQQKSLLDFCCWSWGFPCLTCNKTSINTVKPVFKTT